MSRTRHSSSRSQITPITSLRTEILRLSHDRSLALRRRDRLVLKDDEMTYEIWDFQTGNATGVYPSLLAALQVVHDALERDGETTLEGLALLEVRADGERRLIAQEHDLVPLVGARTPSG